MKKGLDRLSADRNIGSKYIYLAIIIALALLISTSIIYLYNRSSPINKSIEIPEKLDDFTLMSKIEGEEAIEIISRLHIGPVEDLENAVIAVYTNPKDRSIHLWASRFASEDEASKNADAMANSMLTNPELGYDPYNFSLNDISVFYSVAEDRVTIFWAQNMYVFYTLFSDVPFEEAVEIINNFIQRDDHSLLRTLGILDYYC